MPAKVQRAYPICAWDDKAIKLLLLYFHTTKCMQPVYQWAGIVAVEFSGDIGHQLRRIPLRGHARLRPLLQEREDHGHGCDSVTPRLHRHWSEGQAEGPRQSQIAWLNAIGIEPGRVSGGLDPCRHLQVQGLGAQPSRRFQGRSRRPANHEEPEAQLCAGSVAGLPR